MNKGCWGREGGREAMRGGAREAQTSPSKESMRGGGSGGRGKEGGGGSAAPRSETAVFRCFSGTPTAAEEAMHDGPESEGSGVMQDPNQRGGGGRGGY